MSHCGFVSRTWPEFLTKWRGHLRQIIPDPERGPFSRFSWGSLTWVYILGWWKFGTENYQNSEFTQKNICLCWLGLFLFGLVRHLSLVVVSSLILLLFGTVYIYILIHTGFHIFPKWLGWWYGVWKQRCVGERTLVGCCGIEVSTSTRAFTLHGVWRRGAEAFQDLATETSMNHVANVFENKVPGWKMSKVKKTHRKDKIKETQFNDYCFKTWNNHPTELQQDFVEPNSNFILPKLISENWFATSCATTTKNNEVSIQIQVILEIKMSQWCNLTWKEIEVADGCFGKRFVLCLILCFFKFYF